MGKEIRLNKIEKNYGNQTILKGIDLTIYAGERIVLLGPSGSGKSTLLRMIAGLEDISHGELYLGDTLANELECGERDISMVFQNYALYPHMTVEKNVSFALESAKVPSSEINSRVTEALDMLGLTPYKDRLPKDLSGGQRQRTALARAIVKRSEYFLLDEPLSNLDVRLRLDSRIELVKIHEKYHQTFVYVTHDQIEAMTLAHRIVILNEGIIQMVDTPVNVYMRPDNIFTATFIGSPGMNIIPITKKNQYLSISNQEILLSQEWSSYLDKFSDELLLGIRPEHIKCSKTEGMIRGTVEYKELLGPNYALTVSVAEEKIYVITEKSFWEIGEPILLSIPDKKQHYFSKETQKNIGYPYELDKGDSINEIYSSI